MRCAKRLWMVWADSCRTALRLCPTQAIMAYCARGKSGTNGIRRRLMCREIDPAKGEWPPVEQLVPHAPPMLLLDRVLGELPDGVQCEVRPRREPSFGASGGVPAVLCMEYMAQAIAALVGLRRWRQGKALQIGMVVAVRDLVLQEDELEVGVPLSVTATRQWDDDMAGCFETEVTRHGARVASAQITVVEGAPDRGPA